MEHKVQQQEYITSLSRYVESLRKIQQIASKITDQIEHIIHTSDDDENGKTLEKLIGMLQKLSNIMDTIAPLDQKIITYLRDLEPEEEPDPTIDREDCEIILSVVRGWGLLKEDAEIDFNALIKKYEESRKRIIQ